MTGLVQVSVLLAAFLMMQPVGQDSGEGLFGLPMGTPRQVLEEEFGAVPWQGIYFDITHVPHPDPRFEVYRVSVSDLSGLCGLMVETGIHEGEELRTLENQLADELTEMIGKQRGSMMFSYWRVERPEMRADRLREVSLLPQRRNGGADGKITLWFSYENHEDCAPSSPAD